MLLNADFTGYYFVGIGESAQDVPALRIPANTPPFEMCERLLGVTITKELRVFGTVNGVVNLVETLRG